MGRSFYFRLDKVKKRLYWPRSVKIALIWSPTGLEIANKKTPLFFVAIKIKGRESLDAKQNTKMHLIFLPDVGYSWFYYQED